MVFRIALAGAVLAVSLGAAADKLKVDIGDPVTVAVAVREEEWGRFQFPSITRWEDGTLLVGYSVSPDAAESYGSPSAACISRDRGRTWTPYTGKREATGLLLPNGERIAVMTPKPYKEADLRLPKPVGNLTGTYGKQVYTMYRLSELQPMLRTVRLVRAAKGSKDWKPEHSALDDPQALRYTLRGLFPIVWWGDLRLAPDGSVLAGIYPGYRVTDDGKMDPKGGVFFYRSTDFGRSWKVQGRIPYQPDLKADPRGNDRDGFTEPAFEILADGSLFCVMRTTDGVGQGPMYASRSRDLGKTWSKPVAIAPVGVLPRLLRLENGVLVLSSGRPGVEVRFCSDGIGKRWSQPYSIVPPGEGGKHTSCGYTHLLPTGPDSFMIVYSDFTHVNENGETRKAIKVREITVRN